MTTMRSVTSRRLGGRGRSLPLAAVVLALAAVALHPQLAPQIAAADDGGKQLLAYVANESSNNIWVINTLTNVVVTTIPVGRNPTALAATPDGRKVYVSNSKDNTISVIDTATNTVVTTIEEGVGPAPLAIAFTPNGKRAYVTSFGSQAACMSGPPGDPRQGTTVFVIDTKTNVVVETIAGVGPCPTGVAITPNGKRAYVLNERAASVSVIDTTTNTIIGVIRVGFTPVSVAITPNGNRAYVTNLFGNSPFPTPAPDTVSVIDITTNTVIETITVGDGTLGLDITPDGARLYVANSFSGTVSLIDTETNTVIKTITGLGSGPAGVAITPTGTKVYVTNSFSDNVSVIDTLTNEVVETIPVGDEPAGVAITRGFQTTGADEELSWKTTGDLNNARGHQTATLLQDGRVLVASGLGPATTNTSAELFDPVIGSWTTTGNLNSARGFHTATLLQDGRVLVAGGRGFTGFTTTTERFDPATGTWTPTNPMNAGRIVHTATLLPDGRVLVVGGFGAGGFGLTAGTPAEIFNPATGSWTLTAPLPLNEGRAHHTATLLRDGRVLVVGGEVGFAGSGTLRRSAWIFNPATEAWTATGNLNTARSRHTATRLPDGRVLVTGGSGDPTGSAIASVEIFDPATGSWTLTAPMNERRILHTANLLSDGRVLAVGGLIGIGASDPMLARADLFDPATKTWTPIGDLNEARANHSATLLPDGHVLVAGGRAAPSSTLPEIGSAELLDPAKGSWTDSGDLDEARARHTATLLPDGQVLVAGGQSGPAGGSAERFDPVTGTWTATGNLNTRREEGHTATVLSDGRRVLVAGGKGGAARGAELYDPATGTWTTTGNLNIRREGHTASLLTDGRVLVAGGEGKDARSSAELYDPASGTWTPAGNLNTPRDEGHTATLLRDGRVLVAGGNGPAAGSSAERFDPATGTWTPTGNLNTRREGHTATLLPEGRVLVAGGQGAAGRSAEQFDPATGTWTPTGNLNARREGHTATLLRDGEVLVAGGQGASHDDDGGAAGRSAELFDRGLGFVEAWRPVLTSATSPLLLGTSLSLTGSQFRGLSEGSGNNSAQNSPTDYPLVQLHRLDNGQMRFLLADTWSDASFTSVPVTDFAAGHALVTVFTNGVPSIARIVRIAQP